MRQQRKRSREPTKELRIYGNSSQVFYGQYSPQFKLERLQHCFRLRFGQCKVWSVTAIASDAHRLQLLPSLWAKGNKLIEKSFVSFWQCGPSLVHPGSEDTAAVFVFRTGSRSPKIRKQRQRAEKRMLAQNPQELMDKLKEDWEEAGMMLHLVIFVFFLHCNTVKQIYFRSFLQRNVLWCLFLYLY